ncbi:MAG: NifU family protein [Bacteroidota bacterium]
MKRSVIMHVEGSPNPNAVRFVLENGVLVDKPYEFKDFREAKHSPLARKLLMLRYMDRVMLNRNYITLIKKVEGSPAWDQVLIELRMMITQHLEANEPILYLGVEPIEHRRSDEVVISLITDLLDKHIRPAAQEDGGDILFESYMDGKLNLTMHGACHKCPYAQQTMKQGVEKVLTGMVPEVKKVTALGNNVN